MQPVELIVRIELRTIVVATLFALRASAGVSAQDKYVQAEANNEGTIRIVSSSGKVINTPPLFDEAGNQQVESDHIRIAPDRRSVGWLAEFPNCCTSYPIPLTLALYRNGRVRELKGSLRPIWAWCFEMDGKRVAFEQETVHGRDGVHYELRDVVSGRLVGQWDPTIDRETFDEVGNPPRWVAELKARTEKH